jgi:putative transposase
MTERHEEHACKPRWAAPILHAVLKAEALVINHKRTERLYREEGLSLRLRRRRKLPAVARVPLSVPQGPNERWSMDFIHDQLATGRRFRCLTLVDDFTRQCLAIHVDTSIGGASVVAVLQRLALSGRLPKDITVDNGPEFTGKALHLWAQRSGR